MDTQCTIKQGRIVTDLYRKPTARNQYLLTSSCSPATGTENIPYSLALRIVRICPELEAKEARFKELTEFLLARSYRPSLVDAAINRARTIPRAQALKRVDKQIQQRRPIHVVTYDPRLPPVQNIHQKYWKGMTEKNPYLREVFPEPPLVAYRRQKNIKYFLIISKIPKNVNRQSKRDKRGMKKCGKQCPACPFVREGKLVKLNKSSWTINSVVNCESSNIIYLIECSKQGCNERYIGESSRPLKERIQEHRDYIRSMFPTQATGQHFNQKGHSLGDMTVTILEKVKKNDNSYREEREKLLIRKFNTFYKGINRQP